MALKSFDQIQKMVEAVALKKKASCDNLPKDPNEVSLPSTTDSGMIDEKEMQIPSTPDNGPATVTKETTSFPITDSEESAKVNPTVEPTSKVTESTVAKKGSALLAKIQQGAEANVAEGITFDQDILAKIASEILNTEEGAAYAKDLFRKKAGEEYAAAAIKEASEQAALYKQAETKYMNSPLRKIASEVAKLPEDVQETIYARAQIHEQNLSEYEGYELLKRAYAAGVEDAEAVAQNPEVLAAAEEPSVEEAGEAEITAEEVMEAVSEMVEAGEIDEETANALVEEIIAGAEGEEAMAEGAADQAAAEDAMAEVAAADANPAAAKVASEIVRGTILLKKASAEEGLVEDEEANIQDVLDVIQGLVDEGSLSDEDAMAVISEIANAVEDGEAEGEIAGEEVAEAEEKGEEAEEKGEEEDADEDDDADEEVEKVASVLGVR